MFYAFLSQDIAQKGIHFLVGNKIKLFYDNNLVNPH